MYCVVSAQLLSFDQVAKDFHLDGNQTSERKESHARPFVIGGTNFDCIWKGEKTLLFDGSSNRGHIRTATGGVGCNIASAFSQLNWDPVFLSAVGDDGVGDITFASSKDLDRSNILKIKNK